MLTLSPGESCAICFSSVLRSAFILCIWKQLKTLRTGHLIGIAANVPIGIIAFFFRPANRLSLLVGEMNELPGFVWVHLLDGNIMGRKPWRGQDGWFRQAGLFY